MKKKLKSSRKSGSRKGKLHLHVSQVLQVLQSGQCGSVTGVTVVTVGQWYNVTVGTEGQWYNGAVEQWGSGTVWQKRAQSSLNRTVTGFC